LATPDPLGAVKAVSMSIMKAHEKDFSSKSFFRKGQRYSTVGEFV
jgi:hypothetical protein